MTFWQLGIAHRTCHYHPITWHIRHSAMVRHGTGSGPWSIRNRDRETARIEVNGRELPQWTMEFCQHLAGILTVIRLGNITWCRANTVNSVFGPPFFPSRVTPVTFGCNRCMSHRGDPSGKSHWRHKRERNLGESHGVGVIFSIFFIKSVSYFFPEGRACVIREGHAWFVAHGFWNNARPSANMRKSRDRAS